MRARRALSSALIAALAGAALAVAGTAAFADDGQPSAPQSGKIRMSAFQNVNFISACRFSHRAPDDPIVNPGKPGASHDHSFVGNTSTSAFSTLLTLRAGGTSCRRPGDTAAYWVPTLIVDGQTVEPRGATIYYRRRVTDHVQPFPQGLKMIAGDSHSTSPQSPRVTFWNCGAAIMMPPSSTAPACPDELGSGLRLHITFPSCWDGKRKDSADHRSHMAYPDRAACPATHPVAVPAISLIFRYPVTGSHEISLTSGGQYSGHADFFNAWDERTLARLVDSCLNALRHCGRGD